MKNSSIFSLKDTVTKILIFIDDDIEKRSYGMMVGRYAYDGEEDINYVVLVQFTTINLNTLNDNPSKFDLPISPPVWTFTGHVKDPFSDDDDNFMFRLNKDIYNGYTKTTSNTSVICTLKKKNKASYIEEAVNKKPIISVCGELLVCDGSIFNFPSVIEWNYQSNDNTDTQTDGGEKTSKKRKKDLENLQKISNKYKGKDKKELKNNKVSGVKKPSSKKKGNNSDNLENFIDLVNDVTNSKDKGETIDISENNNEGDECEDSNTVDEDAGTEANDGGD